MGSHLLPLKSMRFNKKRLNYTFLHNFKPSINLCFFFFTPKTIRYLVNSDKLIILVSYASAFHTHTCLSFPK